MNERSCRGVTGLLVGALFMATLLFSVPLQAGLVLSVADAGVQATTVAGAITETFDTGAPSTILGTYANEIVLAPSDFGGAFGTSYLGVFDSVTTLELNSPQKYFGMWWSALDADNAISVFDGSALLGSYVPSDLIPIISVDYFGNPNGPGNPSEVYAYVHFTATGSSSITRIEFSNGPNSFFESDNHSVTDQSIVPPGTSLVPEPGSVTLMGLSFAAVFGSRRSRRSRRSV